MNKNLVNLALIIASIFFSFAAIEATLWGYAYLKGNRYPLVFDAELGWAPKPKVQEKDYLRGTTYTTLEDGTRSNGSNQVRDPTELILAVGDSFTWGEQVSDWETWPAQLEKLTGRKVINGGVFAYGIDQTFLRARRLLGRYRVNTLVFSFITSDIARGQDSVIFHMAKPYFDFKDGRLTLENVPVLQASLPKESRLTTLVEHSRLINAVMKRAFPSWWEDRQRSSTQVLDEQKGREVACALLHELEELTKSRNSELIVLIQRGDDYESIEDVLACLSDGATRVLDLKAPLSKLKAEDLARYKRLFIPHDGHMTAEGNQFVALEISKFLAQTSTEIDHISAGSDNSSGEH